MIVYGDVIIKMVEPSFLCAVQYGIKIKLHCNAYSRLQPWAVARAVHNPIDIDSGVQVNMMMMMMMMMMQIMMMVMNDIYVLDCSLNKY